MRTRQKNAYDFRDLHIKIDRQVRFKSSMVSGIVYFEADVLEIADQIINACDLRDHRHIETVTSGEVENSDILIKVNCPDDRSLFLKLSCNSIFAAQI